MLRGVSFVVLSTLATASAQSTDRQDPSALRFEVASVKPSNRDPYSFSMSLGPGGTVRIVGVSLDGIIAYAYELMGIRDRPATSRFSLVLPKSPVISRQFDIEARTTATATMDEKRAMLRTLLAERFKLRVRREVRQVPIFVLRRAREKLGPNLKPSSMNCVAIQAQQMLENYVPPGPSQCWADRKEFARGEAPFRSAGPISHLVTRAQTYLDRPLIDKTGLTGNYEWATRFRSPTSEGDAPLFADALNRDLGLRIEGATGPYEVIVVEGVEMPTPN